MECNTCIEFITTPFCGVCQTVRPMLEILASSLEFPLIEVDANQHEIYLNMLKISKVPAIVVKNKGEIIFQTDYIDNLTNLYNAIAKKL